MMLLMTAIMLKANTAPNSGTVYREAVASNLELGENWNRSIITNLTLRVG